jgi:hypothetical protein
MAGHPQARDRENARGLRAHLVTAHAAAWVGLFQGRFFTYALYGRKMQGWIRLAMSRHGF